MEQSSDALISGQPSARSSGRYARKKLPGKKIPARKFGGGVGSRSTFGTSKPSAQQSSVAKPALLPQCFYDLGFDELPSEQELRARYRILATRLHPDARGSKQEFQQLKSNYDSALAHLATLT